MSSFVRLALILGLLSAIGPFSVDMYLPALPAITEDLRTTTSATQMTLLAFLASFSLLQLIYGPISDAVGRKPPLYFGLVVFLAGSVGCYFAPSIDALIAFRVLQGIGGAAMMVVPRAVIRDLHTGIEATRLMSLVMLVLSVSPILAPLAGSALIEPLGWRAIFAVVIVAALISALAVRFALPETRPPDKRVAVGLGTTLLSYAHLLRDGHFMGVTFVGGFGMASFFVFLASSSFLYIDRFGLTPTEYGLAFGLNAVGFIGASQASASLGARFGMGRVILGAALGHAAMALILLGLVLGGIDGLAVLIGMLFVTFAFLGLVVPASMVLSLERHGPIAGMASALGGTLQMAAGVLTIALGSLFFDGTALPMVATIALCAVGAFVLAVLTLGEKKAKNF